MARSYSEPTLCSSQFVTTIPAKNLLLAVGLGCHLLFSDRSSKKVKMDEILVLDGSQYGEQEQALLDATFTIAAGVAACFSCSCAYLNAELC